MSTYTIGRLAEAAGVHVETIRYYERRGLIEQPPRSPSGYRRYSADDLWRLQFIGRGKRLGFTLAEIADVLGSRGGGSAEMVLAAARAKLAAVDEQLHELAVVRCRLQQLAELCRHGDDADCVALQVAG
ncbi:MAG TPA: MerR family transcriptional regulator [Acidimicrobiales bacterium]|jgi:MerR family transcriptional regulator, mercuric resistance operon regulatory protein|nr:MerR family transcriptional regulator [Acidimicrobiales bacterium]